MPVWGILWCIWQIEKLKELTFFQKNRDRSIRIIAQSLHRPKSLGNWPKCFLVPALQRKDPRLSVKKRRIEKMNTVYVLTYQFPLSGDMPQGLSLCKDLRKLADLS